MVERTVKLSGLGPHRPLLPHGSVQPAPPIPAGPAARAIVGTQVLTAEEVIRILRLKEHAPRAPREALRNLVRSGRLDCLRQGPGKRGRMIFLLRHVEECLDRWEQWGRQCR